jgi:hypothetical protein
MLLMLSVANKPSMLNATNKPINLNAVDAENKPLCSVSN